MICELYMCKNKMNTCFVIYFSFSTCLVVKMFANGQEDRGSMPV